MLPIDEQKQKQHEAAEAKEAQAARYAAMAAEMDEKRELAIGPDDDRPTTEMAAQLGHMMHGDEVRKKLLKLNGFLRFIVAKADPTRVGIYVIDSAANRDDPDHTLRGLRFVCGMEKDFCPEFSVRFTREEKFWNDQKDAEDTRKVFAGEMRGWRTVLARLIRQRLISYPGAIRAFGSTSISKNWHLLTN